MPSWSRLTVLLAMICVAVKIKSGPNAVKINAGNICAQYICCAGVVATEMQATQD
jgi:hypothetical protein